VGWDELEFMDDEFKEHGFLVCVAGVMERDASYSYIKVEKRDFTG